MTPPFLLENDVATQKQERIDVNLSAYDIVPLGSDDISTKGSLPSLAGATCQGLCDLNEFIWPPSLETLCPHSPRCRSSSYKTNTWAHLFHVDFKVSFSYGNFRDLGKPVLRKHHAFELGLRDYLLRD